MAIVEDLRVRIYELVEDGKWHPLGTGLLYVHEDQKKIVILDENDELEIMHHIVDDNIEYELQGNTIITWLEPAKKDKEPMDLALSFQEEEACSATWDWIRNMMPAATEDYGPVQLPTRDNIESICKQLEAIPSMDVPSFDDGKGIYAWFGKLYKLLLEFEKEEDSASCEQVHKVLHLLVKNGNSRLLQTVSLFNKKFIDQILHISEYHPHRPDKHKFPVTDIRDQYHASARVELPNVPFNQKLQHETLRLFTLIFIRDVVFLTLFEDLSLSHFETQIYLVNCAVVTLVASDINLWAKMRENFTACLEKKDDESYDRITIYMSFFHELILKRCKILKLQHRRECILLLVKRGMLDCIYRTILLPENTSITKPLLWRIAVETVYQIYCGIGILEMKNHIIQMEKKTEKSKTFLRRLLTCLHEGCESGLLCQLVYLLRAILLFPDAQPPESALAMREIPPSTFCEVWRIFHEDHVHHMISILDYTPDGKLRQEHLMNVQIHVVGILKTMVDRHEFAMRRTVLKFGVMQKVANLIRVPNKRCSSVEQVTLVLACMRFFRTCINRNEDFYKTRIIDFKILDSSFKLFCLQGNCHNLLNSCFLSLIHEITTHPTQYPKLLRHVGDRYLSALEEVDRKIFSKTREEYDKLLNQNVTNKNAMQEDKKESDDNKQEESQETSPGQKKGENSISPPKEGKCDEVFKEFEPNEGSRPVLPRRKKRKSQSPQEYAAHLSKRQKLFV